MEGEYLKRMIRWLDKYFEEVILCTLLFILTTVMMTQIVLRFGFKIGIVWSEELCRYTFIYTAFFAIPYCIKRKSMLRVDMIVNKFPVRVRRVIELALEVVCLAFWAYIWYYSWFVLQQSLHDEQRSTTMGIGLYWVYGMPFFAFFFAVVRQIQSLYYTIKNFKKPPEEKSEELTFGAE